MGNLIKVKGVSEGEAFTLDKDIGLVTFSRPDDLRYFKSLIQHWNEALQWLPAKSISLLPEAKEDPTNSTVLGFNFLTVELTTGETVYLTDADEEDLPLITHHGGQVYKYKSIWND